MTCTKKPTFLLLSDYLKQQCYNMLTVKLRLDLLFLMSMVFICSQFLSKTKPGFSNTLPFSEIIAPGQIPLFGWAGFLENVQVIVRYLFYILFPKPNFIPFPSVLGQATAPIHHLLAVLDLTIKDINRVK